jgi:hypothetical protein
LKTSVARAGAGVVATLALVGLAAWGCASETNAPIPLHPERSEPDGGWQNYRPEARRFEVDPMQSAMGPTVPCMPTTSPVNPASTTLH